MRLLAITPIRVSDAELARRRQRYDRLAPRGVTVELHNLGDDPSLPAALDTAADIAASEEALFKRFGTADVEGVDAFLPDCVLDPVIEASDSLARPVLGIGRLTACFLAAFGGRIGAVARNRAIASELDRRLDSYGVATAHRTAILDLSVEDIADDATWAAAVERSTTGRDCDYVINACSAVDVSPRGDRPALVDPTQTALRLIGLQAELTGRLG
jgi:Asp/Glu/hydantoin racemase